MSLHPCPTHTISMWAMLEEGPYLFWFLLYLLSLEQSSECSRYSSYIYV